MKNAITAALPQSVIDHLKNITVAELLQVQKQEDTSFKSLIDKINQMRKHGEVDMFHSISIWGGNSTTVQVKLLDENANELKIRVRDESWEIAVHKCYEQFKDAIRRYS